MNIKVNGFRVGVMAALMAIGAAGCKKEGPYAPMPKGFVSQKMEQQMHNYLCVLVIMKTKKKQI